MQIKREQLMQEFSMFLPSVPQPSKVCFVHGEGYCVAIGGM